LASLVFYYGGVGYRNGVVRNRPVRHHDELIEHQDDGFQVTIEHSVSAQVSGDDRKLSARHGHDTGRDLQAGRRSGLLCTAIHANHGYRKESRGL
jgi:hypothetical protein